MGVVESEEMVGCETRLERGRNVRNGEAAGAVDLAAFEHRAKQLRLHRHPIDLDALGVGSLEQDRDRVMHSGAGSASDLLPVEIDRLADTRALTCDYCQRRLVEAHIDGEQG